MAKGDLTPVQYQVVLGTSNTVIVPAIAANTRLHGTAIKVINANASSQTFHLYSVPSGQAETDQYLISPKLSKLDGTSCVNGGGMYSDTTLFMLNTGDKISGISSAASSMTVVIVGLQEVLV
jgi:hypothetical protein